MPEAVLVAKLKADSAISALVGSRIRPHELDQRNDWAAIAESWPNGSACGITYQVISDVSVGGSHGTTKTRRSRIQLNIWGPSKSAVKEVYYLVTAPSFLATVKDLGTDPNISSCHDDGGGDLPEINIPGRDQARARGKRVDLIIWHNAP